MFSKIVVGTDGSPTAAQAVERAGALAGMCGAILHLVHGCGEPPAATQSVMEVPVATPEENLHRLEEHLERQAEALRAGGAEVECHLVPASGAEAILGCVDEVGADLVVVGSQGMTGKRRFILGSVPNAVVHQAPCNVLIVHTDDARS